MLNIIEDIRCDFNAANCDDLVVNAFLSRANNRLQTDFCVLKLNSYMSMQPEQFSKRFLALLLSGVVCATAFFGAPVTSRAESDDPLEELDVPCLIVVDQNDPTAVLYEKNADQRCIPGSTMKIMTCILSLELCDNLDQQVTVTAQAALLKDSNSLMGVIKGETLTIRQLLYGLMLESGNDAALLLAQALGGSTDEFVSLMNEKAASLGMTGTHFVNPSGAYKRDQYSTARDMAVLTCYALKNETFREIVSTVRYTIEPDNVRKRALEMVNSNKLISDPADSRLFYQYATGVKTGSTAQGGKCLVAAANKDGAGVVAVLLGVLEGGSKLERMSRVYEDAITIMDLSFTQFVTLSPADLGLDEKVTLPVSGDPADTVSLTPVFPSDSVSIPRSQAEQLKADRSLISVETSVSELALPVSEGDECAQAVYRFNGRDLFNATLVATENKQAGLMDVGITTVSTPAPSPDAGASGNPALLLPVWLPPVLIGAAVIVIALAVFFFARRAKRQ